MDTKNSPKKISAVEASEKAKSYFREVSNTKDDISVEEVELDEQGKYWLITLGVHSPVTSLPLKAQGLDKLTSYKQFKVDSVTGKVLSMKIRMINFANLQSNA